MPRNSPSLLNLAYAPVFRWDGSLGDDLAEQMVLPFAEANMDIAGQRPAGHTREGRASGRILRQAQDEDLKNG